MFRVYINEYQCTNISMHTQDFVHLQNVCSTRNPPYPALIEWPWTTTSGSLGALTRAVEWRLVGQPGIEGSAGRLRSQPGYDTMYMHVHHFDESILVLEQSTSWLCVFLMVVLS